MTIMLLCYIKIKTTGSDMDFGLMKGNLRNYQAILTFDNLLTDIKYFRYTKRVEMKACLPNNPQTLYNTSFLIEILRVWEYHFKLLT